MFEEKELREKARRLIAEGIRVDLASVDETGPVRIVVTVGKKTPRTFTLDAQYFDSVLDAALSEQHNAKAADPPPAAVGIVKLLSQGDRRHVPMDMDGNILEELWDGKKWVPSDQEPRTD